MRSRLRHRHVVGKMSFGFCFPGLMQSENRKLRRLVRDEQAPILGLLMNPAAKPSETCLIQGSGMQVFLSPTR